MLVFKSPTNQSFNPDGDGIPKSFDDFDIWNVLSMIPWDCQWTEFGTFGAGGRSKTDDESPEPNNGMMPMGHGVHLHL